MGSFSVPVNTLPSGSTLDAPDTVPVFHQGERVANAHFRDGRYAFTLVNEPLEQGLNSGTLYLWSRYVDHFVSAAGALVRHYFAIDIIEKIAAERQANPDEAI
jgi:hypothetical protein